MREVKPWTRLPSQVRGGQGGRIREEGRMAPVIIFGGSVFCKRAQNKHEVTEVLEVQVRVQT